MSRRDDELREDLERAKQLARTAFGGPQAASDGHELGDR